MKYVKEIVIGIGIVILLFGTSYITRVITENRADKDYAKLKVRFDDIEESNIELRELNTGLTNNNNRIREELEESNGFVKRTRDIIGELETGVAGTKDTIERIELGIGAIEQIIEELPEAD